MEHWAWLCRMCGRWFVTLAGEAVHVEVCVFDSHHLPTTNLPTALTHDGWASTAGEGGTAVVISSIETWLVLNWGGEERRGEEIKNMSLVILKPLFILFLSSELDKLIKEREWQKKNAMLDVSSCHRIMWQKNTICFVLRSVLTQKQSKSHLLNNYQTSVQKKVQKIDIHVRQKHNTR